MAERRLPRATDSSAGRAVDVPVNSPEILDVIDAAAFLRVSPATVRTALAAQRLPGKRIGKEWRLSRTALIQWLSEPGEPRHYPARRRSDRDPSPPVPLPTDVPRRRAKRTSRKAG